eukprot:TRINITY_DN11061_c0_g2_i1.p1 TRINITY_DN11061_c0_g2~~TRINITY_DN11061_c0_g2_i1.p1  ORF type:complete len:356 (-),score=61.21 TRINITY_DN11061_c0_g2_i1:54-1121(-)
MGASVCCCVRSSGNSDGEGCSARSRENAEDDAAPFLEIKLPFCVGRKKPHPVLQAGGGIRKNICFVTDKRLRDLEIPWPRRQELPEHFFSEPSSNDFVVAVSHAWRYQSHPDAMGNKERIVKDLLRQATAVHPFSDGCLCFLDFLSVSQRPFKKGQADRTPQELELFSAAIKAMPELYFHADAVLHINLAAEHWTDVPKDGELFTVQAETLNAGVLMQLGDEVRIVGYKPGFEDAAVTFAPLDRVVSINGTPVKSISDVDGQKGEALLEFSPYGRKNTIPAHEKGWVFLERFCSMVKVAMLDFPDALEETVFSNDPATIEQIREGAHRLQVAANAGPEELQQCLKTFMKDLLQFT